MEHVMTIDGWDCTSRVSGVQVGQRVVTKFGSGGEVLAQMEWCCDGERSREGFLLISVQGVGATERVPQRVLGWVMTGSLEGLRGVVSGGRVQDPEDLNLF